MASNSGNREHLSTTVTSVYQSTYSLLLLIIRYTECTVAVIHGCGVYRFIKFNIIIILSNAGLHHDAVHLNAYLNWMWCIAIRMHHNFYCKP